MLKIFYSALPERFSNYSLDSIRLFFQKSQNSTTLHRLVLHKKGQSVLIKL